MKVVGRERSRPLRGSGQRYARARTGLDDPGRLGGLLSVLEHELRTPLAASLIQLDAAEAAMGDAGAPGPAREALASAARQLRTLSLTVRRAIQLETENRIDLYPQRLDLGQLVTDFLSRLRATGLGVWSRIEVHVAKPLIGHWDPAAVEQILDKLLSNALKYGRAEPVVVTVAPAKGGARLSVRDSGGGIAAKDRERIFGRFARAPSSRGVHGMGIGLWVVRHLIAAHGGRVLVRSRPGKGTVLDVWLPDLARPNLARPNLAHD